MKVKFYEDQTKWLGWIETLRGEVVGFIRFDGAIIWDDGTLIFD